jgi:excinuclease ABC subunit A
MFEHNTWYSRLLNTVIDAYGSTMNTPYSEYSEELQHVLLYGDKKVYTVVGTNKQERETTIHETFTGVIHELEHRYTETESDFVRQELERYMTKEVCPVCNGQRLKPESLSVTIDRKNIAQISGLQISHALSWVEMLHEAVFSDREKQIAESIVKEIIERLRFLSAVGLNYLTLSREAETLAGGEAQRIRLASQIGTGLTGVLYVLDEPTIGLHQRDNQRLLATLKRLRDLGNSVLVVEHDQETIEAADYVFDFGPKAGQFGGEIVAQGSVKDLCQNPHSLTGAYIKGKMVVSLDKKKRDNLGDEIVIKGASAHNLKHIDTEIPLGKLVCITGVSGSGKSTLLFDSLYLNAARQLGYVIHEQPGAIDRIDIPSRVKRLTFIDQSPIGKTPRSNPATYTKVFDMIRELYAGTSDAHGMGYSAGRFSFNVKGGRCEACSGEGQVKIEMQFLPDMYVTCDVCHGTRYNSETLHILYRDKSIADVLAMTIDEAIEFFKMAGRIRGKLQTLQDVGLGYIHLGQAAPTLSGGEAQRVKLARELSTRISEHTLYLLDEPTTGLHFADVQKLLEVLNRLVEANNTVVLIEHNLDVIRNADWIIDLGPEGGEEGGEVVAVGDAAHVKASPRSVTGGFV